MPLRLLSDRKSCRTSSHHAGGAVAACAAASTDSRGRRARRRHEREAVTASRSIGGELLQHGRRVADGVSCVGSELEDCGTVSSVLEGGTPDSVNPQSIWMSTLIYCVMLAGAADAAADLASTFSPLLRNRRCRLLDDVTCGFCSLLTSELLSSLCWSSPNTRRLNGPLLE